MQLQDQEEMMMSSVLDAGDEYITSFYDDDDEDGDSSVDGIDNEHMEEMDDFNDQIVQTQ